MAAAAAAAFVAGSAEPAAAQAEGTLQSIGQAVGMLYDATRCIGCQACVSACAQAGGLVRDAKLDSQRQSTPGLSDTMRSSIKLYKPADGSPSFVKQQCMHCIDPACVASCMFRALSKDPASGIVRWNPGLCVGCRYCEIVCPFNVPKFQWQGFNPRIVKCELCGERLAQGREPACTSVCPTQAVVFGKRKNLLAEAAVRTANHPGRYFERRAYGEREAGGTQVLYLSHAPFEKLGLPKLDNESIPQKSLKWQKRVYSYLVVPAVAYGLMVGVLRKRWKHHQEFMKEDEESTGLRPQL